MNSGDANTEPVNRAQRHRRSSGSARPERGASAERIASTNEAVKHVGAATLTYLLTMSYLGIAAFSITHVQLLIDHRVRLPLLIVDVPVKEFFILAPVMVVVFHLVYVLQVYLLARRARQVLLVSSSRRKVLPTLFAQLFNYRLFTPRPWLWLAMRGLLALILLMPLGLLGLIQGKFVPYHNHWVTLVHQGLFTFDIVICVVLVPLILSRSNRWRAWWLKGHFRPGPRFWTRGVFVVIMLFGLWFTWFLAVVPETLLESLWGRRSRVPDLFVTRDLDVSGYRFRTATDDRHAKEAASEPTLSLAKRNLRGANLSGAYMIGVDFRGADLTGARLTDAVLRGADFSVFDSDRTPSPVRRRVETGQTFPSPPGSRRTVLARCDFVGADMRGADLTSADSRAAIYSTADLRGAKLARADLRRASLVGARLAAADLSYASLDGAVLEQVEASCAIFYSASAKGIRGVAAGADGADFRRADLRGSVLTHASLVAADFSDAQLLGSDLRHARLASATALDLRAADLRRAELGAATADPISDSSPDNEVDARGVSFFGAASRDGRRLADLISETEDDLKELGGPQATIERCNRRLSTLLGRSLGGAAGGSPSTGRPHSIPVTKALALRPQSYLDRQTLASMANPRPRIIRSEIELHDLLVESLTRDEVCGDLQLSASLVSKAWGCVAPRDPVFEHRLRRGLLSANQREECKGLARVVEVVSSLDAQRPIAGGIEILVAEGEVLLDLRRGLPSEDCEELELKLDELILADAG